jgi:hypothetical protein
MRLPYCAAFYFIIFLILGWSRPAFGAGTMLLEDLDSVFQTNPVLHQTLLQAFDLWDRAEATGRDTSRATDKNPPWVLYGKPKGTPGRYTVRIELQLELNSWPRHPKLAGLRITPIDPKLAKQLGPTE